MGRRLKYKTKAERLQANRDKVMKHYWKNADEIRKKNLKHYYEKRNIQNS